MRKLTALVVLAAGIGLAMPAQAELRASIRAGTPGASVFVRIGDGAGVRHLPHRPAGPGEVYFPSRRHQGAWHKPEHPHHFWPWRRSFLGYRVNDYDDPLALRPVPSIPPPEEEPAAASPPVEPAPPPDPRGPAIRHARGTVPAAQYVIGEPLAAAVPHVTLDWRLHALPEPPPGLIYARVGRDVLLITAVSRVVEKVVPPG